MKTRLTIRKLLHLFHGAVAILVLALAVSVGFLFANHEKLIESERLRLETDELADELRMSSDVLTHFARAYVVTADPKFEEYYWQVLAIRNGQQPRPDQYQRIYWDLVAATGKVSRGATARVPLQKLMRDIGFTNQEFAKLKEAQRYSDALVRTEEIAMHAVKGLYQDDSGNFSVHWEPDLARARNLMFDQAYYAQKAKIMQSIDDCDVLVTARTTTLAEHYHDKGTQYFTLTIAWLVLLLVVMPISFVAVRKRIGAPVDKLREQTRLVANDLVRLTNVISTISRGESSAAFKARAQPLLHTVGDEIGELAVMQNQMISELQESGDAIAQITADQILAAKGLRETEEKFRQLADNVSDVFYMTSPDLQQMHYVSPAYEEIWGLSTASLYANPRQWGEAILPEDREHTFAALAGLAANEPSMSVEFRIARPDGEVRWILSRGFQVRDAHGTLIRITGIASDITASRHAAEELRESDRRFRDMLGNLELVSLMLDKDARITYCNDYLLRLTGWQRHEIIGRNAFDVLLPPDVVEEMRGVYSALLGDEPAAWHHENEIVTRSGARRLIRWNNSVLRSATGEVVGLASIGEDITEQKQNEDALRQGEERYRTLFDANPLPMWVYDLETLAFLEVNDAAISHYGYSREEFLSLTLVDIRPKDEKPRLLANLQETSDEVVKHSGVWKHRKKDGSIIEVEISSHSVTYAGRLGQLVLALDVTERKLAEQTVAAAQEKYRSIFENSNEGIFQNTPAGGMISANPALARILGFASPEELVRERTDIGHQSFAQPELRKKFVRLLEERGTISNFEYEVRRKDGSLIWVSEQTSVVRDASGQAVRYEGSLQDITTRKRAEAQILESKRFLQSTLDALSSHIAILDNNGVIIEVNGAWNRFAEENQIRTPLRSVGDNYLHLCDNARGSFAEEAPAMAVGIRAVIANETNTFELEYPCHGPGQERWFVARVTRFDGDDEVRVVVAHENITARKRAEANVREAAARLEGIVNSVEGIVWEADGQTRQVNFVSRKAEEILGYPISRWVEEPDFWKTHLHPDDRDETLSLSRARTRSGRVELQYRMIAADGGEVWFRDVASFIDAPGKPGVQRGLMIDITERKQIEETLERQQSELRVLFDLMPAMIWFKDTTNGILRVNQRVAEAAGKTIEEIEGKPSLEIYPSEAAKYYADDLEVIHSGVARLGLVETLTGPEGRKYSVQTDKVPYCDKDGNVIGIVVMAQDITERTRQEAERQVISEIMQSVITTNNLDELLHLAHRSIGKILYAENCFVALHDTKSDLVRFEFWVDEFDPVPTPELVGRGHLRTNLILRTGKPLVLTKELEAQLCAQGAIAKSGSAAASWMGVPLRTPTRTIGVLTVQHYEKEDAYSQRDLEFLSSVGDQIALAIERKQAEDELKQSEDRLAAAQKMAHVGSWEWDVTTNKVVWSDEQYRLFGLEPGKQEASYDLYLSLVHPNQRSEAAGWVNAVWKMKRPSRMDIVIVRRDGQERILNSWADVVLDETGAVVRVVGTSQDVTEREKAERALGESEERFQLVSRATDDAIWDWDVVGNSISYSDSFGSLFGYRSGEFESSLAFWISGIHPEDHDQVMGSLDQFFASREESWSSEYRFRCADNSYAFVLDRGYAVRDAEGKPIRLVGAMMNITPQKRAQADLLTAKETAEAASRSKSEFLANMSHEIRTPMNGIIGMTDLALETDLTRDQREYLGMVKSSANSLLGLINDILDFSKIEAGMLELEAIDFSLRGCINGVLKPLGLRADQKGLELLADISPDVPDHFSGDPLRLRQILINLTANAIKFTERGEVVIKVTNQPGPSGETKLHFSVADTGIGIPVEKQKTIFEPFSQADGSTTRTHGGTGLGLSIASQLIQKMQGQIWLESRLGEGTTFHFTTVLTVQHAPLPASKCGELDDLVAMRVLVVDDNAVNRRILQEMLLHWRMSPMVATSSKSGFKEMLRAAEAGIAYQLVLLDAVMPEMDGFALAEKIQEQPELADATVMMLSSAMPVGTSARCSSLGIASCLTKPVTQSELLDAILAAVSHRPEKLAVRLPETPTTRGALSKSSLRILVAEDNRVNRAVATGILEKQGHVLVHADNGREAVDAFTDGAFDLILMDMQMPQMDGFDATRCIREMEATTGSHIRIVAMTAHAMAGDRERCLAAGMDDYVSKPLLKEDLLRSLRGIGTGERDPESKGSVIHSPGKLLEQCDGDEELAAELVTIFQDNTPALVHAIGEAVEKGDGPTLTASAHKLLSSLGCFGAKAAHACALSLETRGRTNDLRGTKETFSELEREIDRVYAALA
jgi:PAS domain S-box-containing protein